MSIKIKNKYKKVDYVNNLCKICESKTLNNEQLKIDYKLI